MTIEKIQEIFTDPTIYIVLSPFVLCLILVLFMRIKLFLAKRNAEYVCVKAIDQVLRNKNGKNRLYDTVFEIITKEGVVYENIALTNKVPLHKEMTGLYNNKGQKHFLSIDKVYNFVSPYAELIILAFIIVITILLMAS